ncbi:MAG TPA: PspC domain-containing protein [Streptosporangiaceae bacterium]|nr:PspC domain-containing protein [Streptosporangiaceae bacterium]
MTEAKPTKQLVRTRNGRLVAGVCSGIAEYAGIDATVVRLIFLAVAVITFGVGALIYLAAWVVIPEEGETASIAENLIKKTGGS